MSPKHSIDFCPICGGGLCGIRICGVQPKGLSTFTGQQYDNPHGLIICDECEAIWLEPDVTTDHQYPDSEDALCPICSAPLWGETSRWADASDIEALDWVGVVNHDLDIHTDEGLV